jgi:hypothetical protein
MLINKSYHVWDPDIQGRDDAGEYTAANPRLAAEQYAEETYDGFQELYVMVEDEDGVQYEANIEVALLPSFDISVKVKK